MSWRDWWKREKYTDELDGEQWYQHCTLAIFTTTDINCHHEWEVQAQSWLGKIRGCNTWVYVDFCRPCDAIRTRRVVQSTDELAVEAFKNFEWDQSQPESTEWVWA